MSRKRKIRKKKKRSIGSVEKTHTRKIECDSLSGCDQRPHGQCLDGPVKKKGGGERGVMERVETKNI